MISPEFWIDEKLSLVSRDARLLFIGLWNFADDEGNLAYSPMRIKAQVFPYDTDLDLATIKKLIGELITIETVIPYTINDSDYLHIRTFKDHQKINRPTPSKLPPPPHGVLSEYSVSAHGERGSLASLSESSVSPQAQVKLKEVKLKEVNEGHEDDNPSKAFTLYLKAHNGHLNQRESELLNELIDDFGDEKVAEAIDHAVKGNCAHPGYNYLIKALKNPFKPEDSPAPLRLIKKEDIV
jgi:hypothetical protein